MRAQRLLVGMSLLFSVLLLSPTAQAQQSYTIGVEQLEYFPQYSYEGSVYIGFAREFFDLFAKSSGYQFKYEILPIQRLFQTFIEKKIDFKYPDSPYWQQEMKKGLTVHYSQPVVEYIDGVMVLPARKGKGLEQLKILGVPRGFTAWDYLGLIKDGKVELSQNNTFTGLLKQVIIARVDGAYVNMAVANYQLEERLKQPGALVFDESLPHTRGAYLFSSIKYPEVIKAFDEFIIKEKPAIDLLKKKFKVTAGL